MDLDLADISSFYSDGIFIQPYKIFFLLNKSIPSVKSYTNIDEFELYESMEKKGYFKNKKIIKSEIFTEKNKSEFGSYLIILEKNLFLLRDNGSDGRSVGIKILYDQTTPIKEIEKLQTSVFKWQKTDSTNKLFILSQEGYGLDLNDFPIKKIDLNIDLNYNDDFKPINEIILSKLHNTSKGIIMLHGAPGTGKTSYIRSLIGNINKKMIFIPTNYSHHIASPEFTNLLSKVPNSIIIIEDAENILSDRDGVNGGAIANLLNISDGLLSDCLNIQIICSFNTELKKIDPALIRKGRIIAKYKFEPLEVEKANKLSKILGFKVKITEPSTLADIYNPNDMEVKNKTTEIGFR